MEEIADHSEWVIMAYDNDGNMIAQKTTATKHGHSKFMLKTAIMGAAHWGVLQVLTNRYFVPPEEAGSGDEEE